MTVLLKASSIRYEETLITGVLIQQQDLVLSNYSEKLLDWYGIYATTLQDTEEESFFMSLDGVEEKVSYRCEGTDLLDEEDCMKEAVLGFSRPRVPMQIVLQAYNRFSEINSQIASGNISDLYSDHSTVQSTDPISNEPFELPDPAEDVPGAKTERMIDYQEIIELLGDVGPDTFDESIPEDSSVDFEWENLDEILKNGKADPLYEPDLSKQMKSSLTVTEESMNELSACLDQFCQLKSNHFYDELCFEFYVSTMFSCKTNTRIQNGIQFERKDLRNRSIASLPVRSALELEKIIFGYEKDETNDFFVKTSIETIRFLIHLASNLTDEEKKAEISGAAVILCGAVAIISGGTVAVPQKVMEVVVMILMSMSEAAKDYKTLIEGKSVPLLTDQRWAEIDTYYIDYLQIFLLMVPEQVKIDRMLHIIRQNLDLQSVPLYTGISVGAKYRNSIYKVEGRYEG